MVIKDYQKKLDTIRMAEISTFHEMDKIINPPEIPTDGPVLSSTGSTLPTGQAQPATLFKPQSDMKPILLQKGATLSEITKFSATFENFMMHRYSSSNRFPKGAVLRQMLVCMDNYWFMALQEKSLVKETDQKSVLKMIKDEASETYPLHVRRIELLETKQTGDLTWLEHSAITHLFLNITTDPLHLTEKS